jgi:hypothetical protein
MKNYNNTHIIPLPRALNPNPNPNSLVKTTHLYNDVGRIQREAERPVCPLDFERILLKAHRGVEARLLLLG